MLGFLMVYYEANSSKGSVTVAFDQFLNDSINGQFTNFQFLQKFRYQAYLVKFIIDFNLAELQGMDPQAFADPATLSEDIWVFSHCDFINKIISRIYELLYEDKLPRVTEEMRKSLRLTKGKATSDWFLYPDVTIVRVYGFRGFPYVLPAFLTPRIFFMDFSRQKIATEEFHFTKSHKTSSLKFPFTLGPFTFKNRSCVVILDCHICQFQFLLAPKVRYDPHDIVSKRKKRKTKEAREHESLEGLEEIANREEPLED